MFEYFIENDLISLNKSDFKLGDSCINQLLSITHDIYKSFDEGYETRGVVLDIPKAFDKVLGTQLGGEGGRPPLSFFENRKKCPDFGKRGPNCVHPWVEFSILTGFPCNFYKCKNLPPKLSDF